MIQIGWAVFLQPSVPTEFLELFSSYLQEVKGRHYLFSSAVHPGQFLGLALVKAGQAEWEVQIPSHYVLAIVQMDDPKPPFGFAPS